jgi:PAS domain S-box-containing protein
MQHTQEEMLFSQFSLKSLASAAFCLGANARFIYVNEATCNLLEYSREELLTMRLSDVTVDFSESNWSQKWQAIAERGFTRFPYQFRSKSDRILAVEMAIVRIKEEENEFGCAFVREQIKVLNEQDGNLSQNTPSQKETTAIETARASPLSDNIFDVTACGILTINFEGKVTSYNQNFLEMWQIPESLLLSEDPESFQSFLSDRLKNPAFFLQSIKEISRETVSKTDILLELKDGKNFVLYSTPQRLGQKTIGRTWIFWYVSDLQQPIQKKLREEDSLYDSKNRFLSTVCHQFRAFLNIISFSNSLLKRYTNKNTDKKRSLYFNNIQFAVEQITTLLERLVLLGQAEVRQLQCQSKITDLNELCHEIVRSLDPRSDKKTQRIEFINQSNLNDACVDCDFLRHILENVLSNAMKFSADNSKIKLKLSYQNGKLIFYVKDRGIGIPSGDLQRIFEPFYRASNVGDIPGSGLGLAIVKNLVAIHDGKIAVDTLLNVGTTFIVTIPLLVLSDRT